MTSANGGKFRHVAAGEAFRPRAADWNGAMDAARVVSGGGFAQAEATKNRNRNVIVTVYNDSAEDVPRNGIMAITGVKITPGDKASILRDGPILTGDIPSAADDRFCVTLQAIDAGAYGKAVLSGMMPCTVNVIDATHTLAQCDLTSDANGVARLESSNVGDASILWKDTGTGEKDALVIFPWGVSRGDIINVNKTSHGWSAWTAVAADGVADSDWETADTDNNGGYIRKGVVVASVDSDNALVLVGRGHLPYNASYTAGERLWLDADNNGVLVDTEATGDILWMDLDGDDAQLGTILWPAYETETGTEITVTQASHGWSVGDLVIAPDVHTDIWAETPVWYELTNGSVPDLGYAMLRGVVLEVPDGNTAVILIEGRGTVTGSPGYTAGKIYGAIEGSDQPGLQSANEQFEGWFYAIDSSEIWLLPRAPEPMRAIAEEQVGLFWSGASSDSDESDPIYFRLKGNSLLICSANISGSLDGEVYDAAIFLVVRLEEWHETNQYVRVNLNGISVSISVEDKTTSVADGHSHTYSQSRARVIGQTTLDTQIANGSWTQIASASISESGGDSYTITIKMQAYIDGSGVPYVKVQFNGAGDDTAGPTLNLNMLP